MATAIAQRRESQIKEYTFLWEGVDRNNRHIRGETKAASEAVVNSNLRRQGIRITKLRRQTFRGGGRVNEKDITFFTRQLATMLKAGVPLLQSFEIIARGHKNARFSRLMMDIKGRIEAGSSLSQAFREHPGQFDSLYCNLVGAGETSGMLDGILDRLATYKEKILAIKSKIKSALFYPISVIVGAIVEKATIARWTRTLATMFAAGVPLVESLDAVAGASGNAVYAAGTRKIQTEVSTGTTLTNAMHNTGLFPSMVLQMTQIGEESGSLDGMLSRVADFFEREVDDAVAALSSLLEPIIIVFLGVVIGGLVVAMYLPIFKLGAVI